MFLPKGSKLQGSRVLPPETACLTLQWYTKLHTEFPCFREEVFRNHFRQPLLEAAGNLVATRDVKMQDQVTECLARGEPCTIGIALSAAPLVDQQQAVVRESFPTASQEVAILLESMCAFCEVEVHKNEVMETRLMPDKSLCLVAMQVQLFVRTEVEILPCYPDDAHSAVDSLDTDLRTGVTQCMHQAAAPQTEEQRGTDVFVQQQAE